MTLLKLVFLRWVALTAWRGARVLEACSWAAEGRLVREASGAGYGVRSLADMDTGRRELAVLIRGRE